MMTQLAIILLYAVGIASVVWLLTNDPADDPWIDDPDDVENGEGNDAF